MFFDVNGVQPSTSTWNTSPSTFGNHYRNESKTSVCRLCANVRDIMHPIYENKEQQWNISEKINKYLPVVVSPSDQLSQTICGSCLQMLIAWDQFTQQCAEVDIKLRKEARAVPQKVEQITTTSTNDSNDTSSLSVRYNDIKTVLTEYLKTLQIEENSGDLTIMCQSRACAAKRASTVNSFILHMMRVHSTDLGNRSDIEKFVKNTVTFEESLQSDSEGHSYSDSGTAPVPAAERPRPEPDIPCFCCPFCESGFSVKTRLLTHLKTHDIDVEVEQGVTCCGQLHGKQAFIQHLQERHESARPPGAPWCRSCGFTARDDAHLQRHIRDNHHEKKRRKPKPPRDDDKNQKNIPAVCPECNKTLSNKYNMTAHFRRHHGAGAGSVRHVCDQCGKSYSTAGNLRLHAARAHGAGEARAQFVCPRCGERFDTLIGRESHLALHTGARPHPCRFCDKSYRTRDALVRHMDVHLDVRRHTCTACGRGFRKRSHLVAHEATHSAPSPSPSSAPFHDIDDDDVDGGGGGGGELDLAYDRFYAALVALRDHYVRSHAADSGGGGGGPSDVDSEPDAERVGPESDPDLDAYDDLSRSIGRGARGDEGARAAVHAARRLLAGREVYECSACGARLAAPHTFLHHLRIHTGERPAVCHLCGKAFRTAHALRRHITETHERRRRRACPRCARTFANSQNLRQHLRIHTGERPHACPAPGCDKRFAQSGSLHAHLKTHSPRMPFACCSCGARFRLRAGLVRHAARHAGVGAAVARAHSCTHCEAAFRTRRARVTHERRAHLSLLDPAFSMHSVGKSTSNGIAVRPAVVSRDGRGRRRAACGACGAVVALAGWRRHARRHAAPGAGRACAHCGRVFSEAGNLARHVRARHGSGARPHVCPDCGRAFSRAEHLREHAALHSTTQAFLCSVCGLSCRSAAALRVHGAVHVRRHGCTSCGAVFARASQLANHSRRARCTRATRPPAILEETEVGADGSDAGAGRADDEGYAASGTLPDLDDYFDYFS